MSAMQPEVVAEIVAQALARVARRATIPAFSKIAFKDDAVAIEAIDGSFFILRVEVADHIAFYGDQE
ncbi:hypothetical protein [Sphingomonas sp. VNH70]|uniref:hypothetical protein n=1 Tax=Sphingomonas silueang TaxID=3156617 RepID=UPI0032B55F0F